jgi:hypothetical protein
MSDFTGRKKQMILWAAASVFVLLTVQVAAADIADYQKRVNSARSGMQVLLGNVALSETGQELEEPDEEVLRRMRELVPRSENIETPSGTIETSNQWLTDGLSAAEKEQDPAKRARILTELNERLAAISIKLDELQNTAAAARSKDEDKRKLAEILKRPEYQKPAQKTESPASDWIRRLLEWIESWFPKFSPSGTGFSGLGSLVGVLQWVLIIAIIVLLGFVVYKLVPLFAPRFRQRTKKEKKDRVILGEKIGEDQSAEDLFGEAERLAREGDLRGAIRKGYIAFLCEMSDRKLIGLARHKTNRDYLRDVRSRREVYSQMNGLTGVFERHWYGFQVAEDTDWNEFRRRCGDTIKAL